MTLAESNLLFTWDERDETPLTGPEDALDDSTDLFDQGAHWLNLETQLLNDHTPATAYGECFSFPRSSNWLVLRCGHPGVYKVPVAVQGGMIAVASGRQTEFSQPNVYQRMLRLWMDPGHSASPQAVVHPAVQAVRDIVNWLGISQTDAIAVSGISESTFYHWQRNPTVNARANQVAHLSRLRALVQTMVVEFGDVWSTNWFNTGQPTRLDRLRQDTSTIDSLEAEGLGVVREHLKGAIAGTMLSPDMITDDGDAVGFAQAELEAPDTPSRLILPHDQR